MLRRNVIAFAGTAYRNSVIIFGCLIAAAVWLGIWLQVRSDYEESLGKIAEEMNGYQIQSWNCTSSARSKIWIVPC